MQRVRRRILFVALQNSIHVARWIRQISDLGWDLHLFPISNEPPHETLSGVTLHRPAAQPSSHLLEKALAHAQYAIGAAGARNDLASRMLYKAAELARATGLPRVVRRLRRHTASGPVTSTESFDPFGSAQLVRVIHELRPDLIHSMEFQHASYRVLQARREFEGPFPAWLATNWGSDIYLYRHFDEHLPIIREILRSADFYSCECERDVRIAQELGLTATVLPVFPNTGGFDLEELQALRSGERPSRRRLVMVKGYQHFAGRAMTALDALERCRDLLEGYRIVVFAGSYDVKDRVESMARSGWQIRAPSYIPHHEMLRLFGQARLYLGVNISDAISTSLLEAMAMGAFPVQTNTSCCEEWIEDGKSGFAIPPNELGVIVNRLRRALSDDVLVDRAAETNAETVRTRLDARLLRTKTHDFYGRIFEAMGRKGQLGT
jgi:glycosyltransferase involved in cell wall biosynthesis